MASSDRVTRQIEEHLEVGSERARLETMLGVFVRSKGAAIPVQALLDGIKKVHKSVKPKTKIRLKNMSARISKYAGRIEDNVAELEDLLGDVSYDTETIMERLDGMHPPTEENGADVFLWALANRASDPVEKCTPAKVEETTITRKPPSPLPRGGTNMSTGY